MMKTRIFVLLFLLSLSFTAKAANPPTDPPPPPGKTDEQRARDEAAKAKYEKDLAEYNKQKCKCGPKPEMPKPECISMEIPFGNPVHQSLIPSGIILLEREKPSASLFTPQSLAFDFNFNSYINDVKTSPSTGISREVTIYRPNAQGIKYQFKTGESVATPIDKDISFTSKLRMIDANGNPVADNPAYYERIFANGSKARFPANQFIMVKPVIIDADGQEITSDSVEVQVEPIYMDQSIRQIWSAADGLADFVVIDDYKYEIRFYAPENAGSKNGQGLYVPQGNPFKLYSIENPNRSDTNFNNVRITQTIAGTSYIYDWEYVEASNAWMIIAGAGLGKASKHYFGDYRTGDCQIVDETRDATNNLLARKVSNSHNFAWKAEIVDETIDPDGANLKTTYTYYTTPSEAGKYAKIKTVQKPDGSWESYDYDSIGRTTLVVSSYLDAAFNSAAGSAKAVYYSYTPLDTADVLLENDGRPRTVETKILGTTVNKKYFVYKNVGGEGVEIEEEGIAAFGDSANQRKTTVYYAGTADNASKGRVKSITWSDGKKDSYSYEYGTYSANPDPASCSFSAGTGDALRQTIVHGTTANPAGVAGKSTKETKVTDGRSNDVMTENYAYDGTYSRIAWNVQTFDSEHHVIASYNSNGTYSTATWNCCSKDSETTGDGTQYTYSYNLLKQMVSKTKVGGPTTTYTYDVEGHQLSETVSGGGVSLATSATYDLAGRVTSRTDAAGLVTSYSYSNGGRTVTVTLPGGFTEITDKYLDGKIKSVTGTAVIAKYYTYGANQDGSQWTKVCTAVENGSNYVKTTTDALGRTVSEEKPGATGTLTTNYFYNSQRLLSKITSTGQADTLYAYDDFNNQIRSALDLNSNGQIDLSADDRITENETSYLAVNSQWWSVDTSKVYGDNGAVTTSVTKKQLTGLASGTIANTISTDINGNDTITTTTLDRTNKTITQTVNVPDSSADQVSVTVNGLLSTQSTSSNLSYSYTYDGIGRQISQTDPRTGSSVTHYNALGQVDYVQDAAGKQTSFTYETATGRRASVVNALSKATSYTYNARGQILTVRGDASYPLDYVYDSYGRMTQLKTYRDAGLANADVTTWTYQEATGLLTSKTYADNKSVAYTYSADGKLATRTWSRGVVTTYAYDLAGNLTGIDYSDTTPDVGFTYNRLGQQLTVTDAVGSRTFGYDNALRLTSETINGIYNKVISRSYDALGRSSGMNIGTEYAVGYGYDNLGRFSSLRHPGANGDDVYTYSYLANSNLIQSITYPSSITSTKSYEAHRDLVTAIENKYGATTISKYEYTNDDLGRRTAMGKSGTAFTQADTIDSIQPPNETTVQPTYDADGNLLSDGHWNYSWDGENRLVSIESITSILSENRTKVDFAYDYMGRRVSKSVYNWDSNTNAYSLVPVSSYKFVWDGWSLIATFSVTPTLQLAATYLWGEDLSGSLQGAGGVGGLFAATDSSGTYSPAYDGNGNIVAYVDNAGNKVAEYEYDAFGRTTVKAGVKADDMAYRFSTKYLDSETGDYYYGYRYYNADTGRWINRDPMEEKGGKNLYGFCSNDAINGTDRLGLFNRTSIDAVVASLNTVLKKIPCCPDKKNPPSVSLTLSVSISGSKVTGTLTPNVTGSVDILGYYWSDCLSGQRESGLANGGPLPNDWDNYGWRSGGSTYTDAHTGKPPKWFAFLDPSDDAHWEWLGGGNLHFMHQ